LVRKIYLREVPAILNINSVFSFIAVYGSVLDGKLFTCTSIKYIGKANSREYISSYILRKQ